LFNPTIKFMQFTRISKVIVQKRRANILTLLVCFLGPAACLFAQTITLSLKEQPIEKAFKGIEEQTALRFIYSQETIHSAKPVSVQLVKASLQEALDKVFTGQPLSYSMEDGYIMVKKREGTASDFEIKGTVSDEKGNPLTGANVGIKGTDRGTATNVIGDYQVKGADPNDVLVFSYVGRQTQEIRVGGRSYIPAILLPLSRTLDETIIQAYGTTTRRMNIGTISKVSAEEIGQQPVSNPIAALQGRVPGLVISQTSGVPGSSFIIQIRGQNTISPNPNSLIPPLDNPLFIVDGVPFAPQNTNINLFQSLASPGTNVMYNNAYGGISPFNSINPADIESVEILRDADATAIYGSRGANGVILITTKKGQSRKTKFQMNISTGVSRITRTMPLLNTSQYIAMRREAFGNDGLTPNLSLFDRGYAPDLLIFDSVRTIDWKDYFFGSNASVTDINGSLSGGSGATQFLVGAGYRHDSYIFPGDFGNNRGSVNINLHHNAVDQKLGMDWSSNYSVTQNNSSRSPSALVAFTLPPNYPDLTDANGNLNWGYKGLDLYDNPLTYTSQPYTLQTHTLISSLQLSYRLAKDLVLRSSFGFNSVANKESSELPKYSQDPAQSPRASASFGSNDFETWITEPRLEYKKAVANNNVTVMAGGTMQRSINSQSTVMGFNYSNDNLLGSISGATNTTVSDGYSDYKYAAFYARINYSYASRYLVNLNGRRDGSSRFGPGKQFGNFGSAGVGWIFSGEAFSKRWFKRLSFGKLRMSYGTTGNDNIGDYQYIPRWSPNLPYGGIPAYLPQNLFNPDFSWSVNHKLEMGLELGFLNDKVLASMAWYRHRTSDQLIAYQLPSQTGFTSVTANFPASIQNSGWEFEISSLNKKAKDWLWSSSFNLTIPKNELLAFPGMETTAYKNRYVIGQSLNVINTFRYLGIDDSTGIYMFQSKAGKSTSSPADFTDYFVQGNLDPVFYGGFGNNLSYKRFRLDLFFQFAKQLGRNYLQQINNFPPGNFANQPAAVLERWQKQGDHAEIEKFTSNNRTVAANAATIFKNSGAGYSDASYLRLKTVAFSYSLNNHLLQKLGMAGFQFYLDAQNIATFTSYKGNDPETQSFYAVPPLKMIVGGLRLTF
jgi:TonB-dependent starch-binding outer membrane protein SusC